MSTLLRRIHPFLVTMPLVVLACSGADDVTINEGGGGNGGSAGSSSRSGGGGQGGTANGTGGGGESSQPGSSGGGSAPGGGGASGGSGGASSSSGGAPSGGGGSPGGGKGGGAGGVDRDGGASGGGMDAGAPTGSDDCPLDTSDGWDAKWAQYECDVFHLTNAQRTAGAQCQGKAMPAVPALKMDPVLRKVARAHAKDMADHNYFDHTAPDGSTPSSRITAAGYTWKAAGENIAEGQRSPKEAVDSWMASTHGHCENIMSANYKDIGVGYAYTASGQFHHQWVQDFATKR